MDDVTALRDALLDMQPYTRDSHEYAEFSTTLVALIAAIEARAIEGSGVGHEPVLFDPTGPVYDSLPHPKASRYELSGALLRDQSADPLTDPDAYDRRILLVTVASAARVLAAFTPPATWHEYKPRSNRMGSPCQRCGQSPFYVDHAPPASVRFDTRKQQSTHDFSPQTTPEADR